MTADIRIATDLHRHPKTLKMIRRLGERSFRALIALWGWAGTNREDGDLSGMDTEDIALAADWMDAPANFVAVLSEVGFLDGEPGAYLLHDWVESQPWIAERAARQERARELVAIRWAKRRASETDTARNTARNTPRTQNGYGAQYSQPNPTQPNPTQIPSTNVDGGTTSGQARVAPAAVAPGEPEEQPKPSKGRKPRTHRIGLDRETWHFTGITDDDKARWLDANPEVDLDRELKALEVWCEANPRKAPRADVARFIVGCLNRAQDRARKAVPTNNAAQPHQYAPAFKTARERAQEREAAENVERMRRFYDLYQPPGMPFDPDADPAEWKRAREEYDARQAAGGAA